ncbi:hypothetical protein NRK68_14730 [Streptomyces yangpuensis]|uniref:HTH luxR-type domain-containing protein n=1 Tax=Streptomyces yangpuensis TaxID=1648182 RepID=A0ABY5PWR5_9ACTN|nr:MULTISPECIES: hypothetical protein [Streptomyces]MBZ9596458.1 hypothetical protein [Streptomyces erythrochromogenes]UUY48347.1 hypothetical protein NRK68_14730 [Streptomyces yangpuensis]
MRNVYLQGAPVWDVPLWVTDETVAYYASGARRYGSDWRKFCGKSMRAARGHRKKILSDRRKPFTFHLEPLHPLLAPMLQEQLGIDLPVGWNRTEKECAIIAGLEYVDTGRLTQREKESFHMACVIRGPRAEIAGVMGITTDGLKAHVSNSWKKMRDDGIDVKAMKWFLGGDIPKQSGT